MSTKSSKLEKIVANDHISVLLMVKSKLFKSESLRKTKLLLQQIQQKQVFDVWLE